MVLDSRPMKESITWGVYHEEDIYEILLRGIRSEDTREVND